MANTMEKFITDLEGFSAGTTSDEATRYRVKEAARRLLARTQTPFERGWDLVLETPILTAALQICMDIGLFEGWSKAGNCEASLEEMLALCSKKCEVNLLRRLLRVLAGFDLIEEAGEDRWKPTRFSSELGDPEGTMAQLMLSQKYYMLDVAKNLTQFLDKTGYRDPVDPDSSNFKDALGKDFFAYLKTDTRYQKTFINGIMVGIHTYKMDWTEVFDTRTLMEGYQGGESTFFVDIGGGHGIDCMRTLAKHPDLPAGSLVLQDLAGVVSMAKVAPKVKTLAHSFFDPQPILGSRTYFLHAVLHDWNDPDTRRILQHIISAMKKGYSKLLIYENVIPPAGAKAYQTGIDLCLMGLLSSWERTESAWRTLLEGVGLRVVKFWRHDRSIESVIETEVA